MQENEIVLYQPNEAIRLEVRMEKETVWLNRNQMAILFGRDVKTIGKHINNALHEELHDLATVAKFAIVQNEGGRQVSRMVEFYNLDMILSVGYRVKSCQGVLFRQWANSVLKEYLLISIPTSPMPNYNSTYNVTIASMPLSPCMCSLARTTVSFWLTTRFTISEPALKTSANAGSPS